MAVSFPGTMWECRVQKPPAGMQSAHHLGFDTATSVNFFQVFSGKKTSLAMHADQAPAYGMGERHYKRAFERVWTVLGGDHV